MEWFVWVLISAIILSLYEVVRKKILKKEHSLELLAVTYITVSILQLFLIPWVDFQVPFFTLFIILVRSIIVAVSILFLTKALHHLEISSVTPLKNLTPLFLLFLSAIFLNEKVGPLQIIGIFLIVTGSYLLQIHDHYLDFFRHIKDFKNKYMYYALGGAGLLSIAAMLTKTVLTTVQPVTYMFYSNIFIAVYFAISLFVQYDGFTDIKLGYMQGKWWILLLAVFLIGMDMTYYTAIAMPAVMISLVVPVRRLSTLISSLIGGRMFHDHFLFHKIMSAIILIIGASLVIMG